MPSEFGAASQKALLDYKRRFRHANGLITVLPGRDGTVQSLSLYRHAPNQHFSAADTRLCHHLVPHLMEALAINRSLALAALPPSFGEQRYPGAIVALSGYILHAEAAFLDLLRAEWPQAEALHLPEALRAALVAQGRPAFLGEAIAVRRVLGGEPLFLRARTRLPVDRLTARELAIAQCLAAGDSYKTIARKLSIAPATVRNHIAGAHERLGIRSNAELVLHQRPPPSECATRTRTGCALDARWLRGLMHLHHWQARRRFLCSPCAAGRPCQPRRKRPGGSTRLPPGTVRAALPCPCAAARAAPLGHAPSPAGETHDTSSSNGLDGGPRGRTGHRRLRRAGSPGRDRGGPSVDRRPLRRRSAERHRHARPYTDGMRTISDLRDPFTDGSRSSSAPRDPYSEGGN